MDQDCLAGTARQDNTATDILYKATPGKVKGDFRSPNGLDFLLSSVTFNVVV